MKKKSTYSEICRLALNSDTSSVFFGGVLDIVSKIMDVKGIILTRLEGSTFDIRASLGVSDKEREAYEHIQLGDKEIRAFGEKVKLGASQHVEAITGENNVMSGIFIIARDKAFDETEKDFLSETAGIISFAIEYYSQKERLKKAKRMAEIGGITAKVAHDIRNPLGVINVAVYNLRQYIKDEAGEKRLKNIGEKVKDANRIIKDLLEYARVTEINVSEVDVTAIFENMLSQLNSEFPDKKINVKRNIIPLKFNGDPVQLERAIYNILKNAFEAVDTGTGEVSLSAKMAHDKKTVEIEVVDNGPGFTEENLKKAFGLFFSTKPKNTGLGLATARAIIHDNHKGNIDIISEEKKGAKVKISIPLML